MTAETASAARRWTALMDDTVAEVFTTMLGLECVPAAKAAAETAVAARVEFSGALEGGCAVAFDRAAAAQFAAAMLGEAADEAMAGDAAGELCNMLAGGWKRRLRPPASGAALSVPVVTRGEDSPASDVRQGYEFDGTQFAVGLTVATIAEE